MSYYPTRSVKPRPNLPEPSKGEHWTKTLARRPAGQKYGKGWQGGSIEVDGDNYIDFYDKDEETE